MSRWILVTIFVAVLAGLLLFLQCGREREIKEEATLSLAEVLSGDNEGFARALAVRDFLFPADHGPHPEFKTEWWYFTGNLQTVSGRAFGFQFTLFRIALSPVPQNRESQWAANQIYMAHLALTDVENGKFRAFERFARGAMGLAGAAAEPLHLWLEDWSVQEAGPSPIPGVPIMHLKASEEGIGVELKFNSVKPVVLQGDRGLSRKGRDSGNASYYYSLTRLEAEGKVTVPGGEFDVRGLAWMDREWSTSVLEKDQVGWDWFALQLDNGIELVLYRMRRADGSADSFSQGCFIDPEGRSSAIRSEEVVIETLSSWKNSDGEQYPSRRRLSFPAQDTVLEIEPLLADQELRLAIRYWEGAVSVTGRMADTPVHGKGYVELTGYAAPPLKFR